MATLIAYFSTLLIDSPASKATSMRPYSLFQAFASRGENVGYELLSFKQLYNMLDDRQTGVGLIFRIRVFILTTR